MTPKDKAKELFDKYFIYLRANLMYDQEAKEDAKQCALIAVDEILKSHNNLYGVNSKKTKFYLEVKQEIELL
jgi:hypothetical protein